MSADKIAVATGSVYCRCGHRQAMHALNGHGSCFSRHCPDCAKFRASEARS